MEIPDCPYKVVYTQLASKLVSDEKITPSAGDHGVCGLVADAMSINNYFNR